MGSGNSSLKKENQELREKITVLNTRINELESKLSRKENGKAHHAKLSEMSDKQIDHFVDKVLDGNNIAYFPDWVEKKIYRTMVTIVINILDQAIDTASIKLIGHEIKLDLVPDVEIKL